MARFKTGQVFIQYTVTESAIYRITSNKKQLRIIQSYIKIVLADEREKIYHRKIKFTVKENYLVKTISSQ